MENISKLFRPDREILTYSSKAVVNARAQGNHASLFSRLLTEADESERAELGDLQVRWEAMGLIVAGSDTTAVTLTYLVWAVLKNSQLQNRLEDELEHNSGHLQDQDLERLPLLNAVIDETLRLYGAAPGSLPRTVPASGATIDGIFLPSGATVSTQAYTTHRLASVFKDPER